MENFTAGGVTTMTSVSNEQTWPSAIALDDGNIVVVYSSDYVSNNTYQLYAKKYKPDGTELIGVTQLSTTGTSGGMIEYMRPSIAARPSGGFIMAWCDNTTVYMRRFGNNLVAETAETVVDSSHGDYGNNFTNYHCEIGIFSDNTYVISYVDRSTTNESIKYKIYGVDDLVDYTGTALERTSGSGDHFYNHSLTTTGSDFGIVAQTAAPRIYGFSASKTNSQHSSNTTNFTGTLILDLNTLPFSGDFDHPTIAPGPSEWLVAAYDNNGDDTIRLFRMTTDFSTVYEQDASNPIAADVSTEEHPKIGVLSNGDLIVSYLDKGVFTSTNRNVELHYMTYNSSGTDELKYTRDASPTAVTDSGVTRAQLALHAFNQHFIVLWGEGGGTGVWDVKMEFYYGVVCFCRGSLISTPSGEKPVESLRPGDLVIGSDRSPKVVINTELYRHRITPSNHPVVVRRGALAPDHPHSNLYLSPDHKIKLNGRMKSVVRLIEKSIDVEWAEGDGDYIDYYHVEVRGHGNIFANGIEVESFQKPLPKFKRKMLRDPKTQKK